MNDSGSGSSSSVNIFRPKRKGSDISFLNTISIDIQYSLSIDLKLTKTYYDKQKFDWDIYIILLSQEKNLNIIPEVLKINYDEPGNISPTEMYFKNESFDSVNIGINTRPITFKASIEFDIKNLYSLHQIFITEPLQNCHLVINELISFLKYLKSIKIQVNNLSINTLFINKITYRFYLVDTVSITTGDFLDTGIQMLNTSIQDSSIKKDIKKYFRDQLGIYGKNCMTEDTLVNIIKMYN